MFEVVKKEKITPKQLCLSLVGFDAKSYALVFEERGGFYGEEGGGANRFRFSDLVRV